MTDSTYHDEDLMVTAIAIGDVRPGMRLHCIDGSVRRVVFVRSLEAEILWCVPDDAPLGSDGYELDEEGIFCGEDLGFEEVTGLRID